MTDDRKQKSVAILTVCLVLDLLAFTCILPLFPYILEIYSQKEDANGIYQKLNGLLATFKQFVGAPDVSRFNYVFYGGDLSHANLFVM